MGRPARIFVPGYPSHVTQRGNDGQDTFRCESDYRFLWRCLRKAAARYGVAVNSYVFMTNHVHLLLTPDEPRSVSRMMHWVTRTYSGYFNARYERSGALWQGRFRASLVKRDQYFLACHRYIDLNPVRAGLVRRPADYAWSSHRHYALGEANPLITPHRAMSQLGTDAEGRRRSYAALFDEPLSEDVLRAIRNGTKSGRELGCEVRRGPRRRVFVPGTNQGQVTARSCEPG
jgi:putative transposase